MLKKQQLCTAYLKDYELIKKVFFISYNLQMDNQEQCEAKGSG